MAIVHSAALASTLLDVEGVVTGVDGSNVALLGGLLHLDATSAVITSRSSGATLGITDILPGAEVHAAVSSVRADGVLAASAIQVGRLEATVEITSAIDSVDPAAGTFKLLGQSIGTNSATLFAGATLRGPVHTLADLKAGDAVDVTAAPSSSGLLAIRVRAEKPRPIGDHVEFDGTVESESADSWVISGKTVLVTSETEISGSPAIGDTVKVEALRAADGTLTALEIQKTSPPPAGGDHVEFDGTIESMSPASWVISGKTLFITAHTQIVGAPHVGDAVKVEALRAADGTLTALEIRKTTSSPPTGERIEFTGKVESKGAGSWVVSGKTVLVTAQTEIKGSPSVGDKVDVKGTIASDGTITAQRIQKNDDGGNGGGDTGGGGHHH